MRRLNPPASGDDCSAMCGDRVSDKVVPLREERAFIPGEPSAKIIAMLETVLAEARAGNITGLALATTGPPNKAGQGFHYEAGFGLSLGGALLRLSHDYGCHLGLEA